MRGAAVQAGKGLPQGLQFRHKLGGFGARQLQAQKFLDLAGKNNDGNAGGEPTVTGWGTYLI